MESLYDRSQTLASLARAEAAATAESERAEAFAALAWLEDYRTLAPLTALVLDARRPVAVRTAASNVVAGYDDTTTPEIRRTWWGSGDPVTRRHALRLMERTEADIVIPVAADDRDPLQATALGAISIGFGEAEFIPVLVRALNHGDREIRRVAADVLLWEEPIAAEEGLLAAARDRSPGLAVTALETLRYYHTRRVLRAVAELCDSEDERVRAAATVSFDELREEFESMLHVADPKEAGLLRDWARPIADLLRPRSEPALEYRPARPFSPLRRSAGTVISERDLRGILDNPDQDWNAMATTLRRIDWLAFDSAARARLTAQLLAHPDPLIREISCVAFAEWSDSSALLTLTTDISFTVRKSAVYSLILLPPQPDIAARAWEYLATATGTTGYEALRTYVAHAPEGEPVDRLVDLARTDPRETIRHYAIEGLGNLEAPKAIRALVPLLHESPAVTWAVHTGLVNQLTRFGIPGTLPSYLATVDDLYLARAIAQHESHAYRPAK
ncbi:HEAT repeat domain-containing protein [Nocardia acidivorans]|uniref:HEAT repeat domain-containing protein n=1 Tax=Nocardia acidivorans TaxID=404580 RepID=UPI000832193D|nr:HEAT repeat domain-containing protein [Nocardia acidivorans]